MTARHGSCAEGGLRKMREHPAPKAVKLKSMGFVNANRSEEDLQDVRISIHG